jgi:DNA-binding NarL/FixJ family response regulator
LRRKIETDFRFAICADAADAAGTVSAALRWQPDICVLDMQLPGGGLSATWEIGGRLPRAKLVILTASTGDSDLFAALRAGADGYLLKTADFGNLPTALYGVWTGEAAVDPAFVARMLRHFRAREPRWRRPVGAGPRVSEQLRQADLAAPDVRLIGREWAAPDARLTSREWEVLDLLSRGLSTAEISRDLMISPSAVRVHIAAVVRKLRVRDRAAAVQVLRGSDTPGPALR